MPLHSCAVRELISTTWSDDWYEVGVVGHRSLREVGAADTALKSVLAASVTSGQTFKQAHCGMPAFCVIIWADLRGGNLSRKSVMYSTIWNKQQKRTTWAQVMNVVYTKHEEVYRNHKSAILIKNMCKVTHFSNPITYKSGGILVFYPLMLIGGTICSVWLLAETRIMFIPAKFVIYTFMASQSHPQYWTKT